MMKLSLLTFELGKGFTLDELLAICARYGCKGLECRAELDHKHGVELAATAQQRSEIKAKFEDSPVELVGIGTGCCFDSLDPAERQEHVDVARRFVDLAVDVGAPRIRVFGNAFPEGSDKAEVVENVGHCLREIAEHTEGTGVDCNLEMHGDFYYWEYALRSVEIADHLGIGIVYNCDPRETNWGPIGNHLDPIRPYLRHVHLHDLEATDYPYPELFRILKNMGYAGFASLECSASDDPERVIAIYARLFEWMYWNV